MRTLIAAMTCCLFVLGAGAQPRGLDYLISLERAPTQVIDVTATLDDVRTEHVDFVLPTWRSGRYVILDFAATVRDVRAESDNGQPLPVRKVDKTTWRVTTHGSERVVLRYGVFADSRDDRTRYLDSTHCFIDASAVMMHVPARRVLEHTVRVEAPATWDVVTGLEPHASEPMAWVSPTYDVLADSPFEMGELELLSFESHGIPHEIAIWGTRQQQIEFDAERVTEEFKLIADTQIELFGSAPYDRYVFMLHVYPGAGGGTEHLNSTIMGAHPSVFESDSRFLGLLGLVAHELFHTWNVKHFRPAGITPYDFVRENYTPSLWIAEGTTSYYDELLLARTGQMDLNDYLGRVEGGVERTRFKRGSSRQSLSESSWDAWIHLFALQKHADARNTQVNFYGRGALASLCLDLRIRELTAGERSLDDVMRRMYERHPWTEGGYTPEDFRAVAGEVAGADLSSWFEDHIDNTVPLPLEDALRAGGLELVFEPGEGSFAGIRSRSQNGSQVVTGIDENGPAFGSGLVAGDEIIAVDGQRVGSGSLNGVFDEYDPGETVVILYFRHERLRTLALTLAPSPYGTYSIEPVDEPSDQQRAIFEAWTGQPWDEL